MTKAHPAYRKYLPSLNFILPFLNNSNAHFSNEPWAIECSRASLNTNKLVSSLLNLLPSIWCTCSYLIKSLPSNSLAAFLYMVRMEYFLSNGLRLFSRIILKMVERLRPVLLAMSSILVVVRVYNFLTKSTFSSFALRGYLNPASLRAI